MRSENLTVNNKYWYRTHSSIPQFYTHSFSGLFRILERVKEELEMSFVVLKWECSRGMQSQDSVLKDGTNYSITFGICRNAEIAAFGLMLYIHQFKKKTP